jgi:kynureninase
MAGARPEAALCDSEDPSPRTLARAPGSGIHLAWNRPGGPAGRVVAEPQQRDALPDLWARLAGAPSGTCVMSAGDVAAAIESVLDRLVRPEGHRLGIAAFGPVDAKVDSALSGWLERQGLAPGRRLARVGPRLGEHRVRAGDVVDFLRRYGHEYLFAWVPAVDPLTGVPLDVDAIAAAGRGAGCIVGCDAGAVGARDVRLSDWAVDCALWSVSGYLGEFEEPRVVTYLRERPDPGVARDDAGGCDGLGAALTDALRAGPKALEARGRRLAAFLRAEVEQRVEGLTILPDDEDAGDSALWVAVLVPADADAVVSELRRRHRVTAARLAPSVVALVPAPLYTTFQECVDGATALGSVLREAAPVSAARHDDIAHGSGL